MSTHELSAKSSQQQRNLFIWCSYTHQVAMGWHVDTDAPTSISTTHRWISTIVQNEHPRAPPRPFALFPVVIRPTGVFMYVIKQSGSALCRESEENIAPGDYGIYNEDGSQPSVDYIFTPIPLSYSSWGASFEEYSVALAKKAALPRSIADQVLARDKGCVFTGVSLPTSDSEKLEVTWIFPPFLGYTLSGNQQLQRAYHDNPDSCDLSEFMVATNAVSGCWDVVALFYDNKLGIDVDDSYRIVVFDKSERMANAAPFKSHVTFVDGQDRPDDRYLRLHFQRCLSVSVCGGDPTEDFEEQEIEIFVEELGVYDDTMDLSDAKWNTRLGREVRAALARGEEMNMEGV